MIRKHVVLSLLAFIMVLLALACSSSVDSISQEMPKETLVQPQDKITQVFIETFEPIETADATSAPLVTADIPDPLGKLLNLRSTKFTLSAIHPIDGTSSITGEIDAAGNMHIVFSQPPIDPAEISEELILLEENRSYEVYNIADQAYVQYDSTWTAYTSTADFITELTSQMHGLSGFTTWLDLLPLGSLEMNGSENTGGFSTNKYKVSGAISSELITGWLWYDQSSHALVKAELYIPAILDSDPENPVNGDISIRLDTEQVEIPPITLPVE